MAGCRGLHARCVLIRRRVGCFEPRLLRLLQLCILGNSEGEDARACAASGTKVS